MPNRHISGTSALLSALLLAGSLLVAPVVLTAPGAGAQDPSATTTSTAGATTEATGATTSPQRSTVAPDPSPESTAAPTGDTGGPTTTVSGSGDGQSPEPDTTDPAGEADPTATTLPTGPPEGFTEEQFRTFVDVVEACGPDPGWVCRQLLAWTGNRTVAEGAQWVADGPVRMAIVALVALVVNWAVRRGIDRYVRRLTERAADPTEPDRHRDERRALRLATASSSLRSAATAAIFTVALFVGLAQLDIDLGPLLAGAGIAGVALGFGAQNIVRDVLAGIFVIVEDQYGIGDVIDVGRASGVVEGISLRTTQVRDIEGTLWFVPNGTVSEVGNMTQRWARVILDVSVAYGSDHHRAGELVLDAAEEMYRDPDSPARILEEPELWGVEDLGENAVVLRVAVKSAPADQWAVARALRSRIKDRFDAEGIEIPFPQRTMWVRGGEGPPDA